MSGIERFVPYKDPEQRRRYGRDWMKRNPEKARAAMRRWRQNHRDEHAARTRARYARDPRAFQRMVDASPNRAAVRRAAAHRRRDAVRGHPSFTAAEWLVLLADHAGRCAYCGGAGPLQADHRVPLARGGTNDIGNILPACRSCNARKHLMTEDEFRARLAEKDRRRDNLQFDQ